MELDLIIAILRDALINAQHGLINPIGGVVDGKGYVITISEATNAGLDDPQQAGADVRGVEPEEGQS